MTATRASARPTSPKAIVRHGWNRASLLYRTGSSSADVFRHTPLR
jgi:hypothetical protein